MAPSPKGGCCDFAQIKVVAVVHNDADAPYNISGIIGSLNLVQDFSMHVQNFTAQVSKFAALLAAVFQRYPQTASGDQAQHPAAASASQPA